MDDYKFKYSIIIVLFGNYFEIVDELSKIFKHLESAPIECETIIICDGEIWENLPLLQIYKYNKKFKLLFHPWCNNVGRLLNIALQNVTSEFMIFGWLGNIYDFVSIRNNINILHKNPNTAFLYTEINDFPYQNIHHGLIQCGNYIQLQSCIFRTKVIKKYQFSEEIFLQKYIDWDFFLKISKYHDTVYSDCLFVEFKWDFVNFPMTKNYFFPRDYVHRKLLNSNVNGEIKITVIGGIWEHTHNQLSLFNFFETKAGQLRFNWKTIIDFSATIEDLSNTDLVIISRGRHENLTNLIKYCNLNKIPTLYLLDDNWFTVAEDWPEYKDNFSPGSSNYECFTSHITNCTGVIIFNLEMMSYILKFNKNIILLEPNIQFKDFNFLPNKFEKSIIGYAGTPRKNVAAFRGLTKFMQHNMDKWQLIIAGIDVPDELKPVTNITQFNYVSYHLYAKTISQLNPQILIAPLDNTISSRSKCPNKFLEITAAGAVGIYSDIEPYSSIVINNQNGMMIPAQKNDDPEEWYKAMNYLSKNESSRSCLYKNAYDLVKNNYSTEKQYANFEKKIMNFYHDYKKENII